MRRLLIILCIISMIVIPVRAEDVYECSSGVYCTISSDNVLEIYSKTNRGRISTSFGMYSFPWKNNKTPIELIIRDGIVYIEDWCFKDTLLNGNTLLPQRLTYIGKMTFYDCGLSAIYIPYSVEQIGGDAFYGIENVYCEAPEEYFDSPYFSNCFDGAKNVVYGCSSDDFQYCMDYGHDLNLDYTIDKEATCVEKGEKSRHCNRCGGHFNVEEIPLKAHEPVPFDQVDPTCTQYGRTAGTKCKNCDKILSGNETMLMIYHNYIEAGVSKGETPKLPGTADYVCSVCRKHITKEIPVLRLPSVKKITIKAKKKLCKIKPNESLKQNELFEVRYSYKKNMKNSKLKIIKQNGVTLKRKKNKKLYLKIRAGATNSVDEMFYSKWTKRMTK